MAVLICLVWRSRSRYKTVWYYALLLLLTNTHLLATLLAASLHIYFLLCQVENKKSRRVIVGHALLGIVVALPAVLFILPPSDSQLMTQVHTGSQLAVRAKAFMQAPLRSMLPMPAWWNYNWWNTQCMIAAKESSALIRVLGLAVSMALPVLAFFILRKERKSLLLFLANLLFNIMIALTVITLGTARYAGFIFISFIIALWLYCEARPLLAWKKYAVNAMLVLHLAAGIFAVIKDMRYPFSNAYRVQELVKKVPGNKQLVCDYWAVNTYAAFVDRPVYCIDLQKEAGYILFDRHLAQVQRLKNRYVAGMILLHTDMVYMISTHSPETLLKIDPQLDRQFQLRLIEKREGAIEKFGNVYLYSIKTF